MFFSFPFPFKIGLLYTPYPPYHSNLCNFSARTDFYHQGCCYIASFSLNLCNSLFFTVAELKCAVQCYAWGKIGLTSTVAQLARQSPSFKLEEDKPYSEVQFQTDVITHYHLLSLLN